MTEITGAKTGEISDTFKDMIRNNFDPNNRYIIHSFQLTITYRDNSHSSVK